MAVGMKSSACFKRSFGSAQLKRRKPAPACAEAFAAEAGDAELVVGAFQQVHRQAVARDAELVADGRDVREDVERRGRIERA